MRRYLKDGAQLKAPYRSLLAAALEPSPPQHAAAFRFIDLFAGIGGLRRPFEEMGGNCVFSSEWDKYAVHTYRANFHDLHDVVGDITAYPVSAIPEHDVLLAGFPCQPFSLAGVSKKNSLGRPHGFLDKTQGTLFQNIVAILRDKQPLGFLLENVKNLRAHDGGRTYEVILGALDELGYHVHSIVIDSQPWVPQRRERIFIVGFKERLQFSFSEMAIPNEGPRLGTILHSPDEAPEAHYTLRRSGRTVVSDRYTLSDHLWSYLQRYSAKHRAAGNGFGFSLFTAEDVSRTLSARYHKDGSEILIAQPRRNPRRLTPRECARLMGFDTPGRRPWVLPPAVSDTQAYRQFGNSVVVPVVEAVARLVVPRIVSPERYRSRNQASGQRSHHVSRK
jgi:DNA (cytosine-5)-methyltransferase 1